MRSRIFAAVLVAFAAAACDGAGWRGPSLPPPPPPPPAQPVNPVLPVKLTIGAPNDAGGMSPLADGQDIALAPGAQGGFHVMLELETHGLGAGAVWIERTAHRVSDGAVVLRYKDQTDVTPAADDTWLSGGIRTFMCPTPIGVSIVDVPIAYQMRLLRDDGSELARAGVRLVPRCPSTQQDFCRRICTG